MVQNGRVPVTRDPIISLSDAITVNPMTILPKPNEFVFNRPEAWRFWKERFLRYGRLTAHQWEYSEADWIDLLCYTMGEQSEEIMEQIMPDVGDKDLAEVLQAFTEYFGHNMKNVTLQRYRFNSRIQLPDESVEQFITVLHILAESCQYGIMKDELIRDRIVAGLSNATILEKLQLESCLTLENTIAIAREVEIQRSQHDEVSQDSSSTGEINCATERSEAQQFLSDKGNDSESSDKENCEHNKCRETGDLEIGGEPEPVHCAKKKDSQKSAEKDNNDSDMGHDQQTHSFADKVENTAAISDHSLYNWRRPGQLELGDANNEEAHVKNVYETVQQVINDLKPENFSESVYQIKALKINSQAVLQYVADLIYEKAVDEPGSSIRYALMCKALAMMQVSSPDSRVDQEESNFQLRILIRTRCHIEFEKNITDPSARAIEKQEIEACADPEKKEALQYILSEDERRFRMKSVGNIRFIGELSELGMLSVHFMHRCIHHLLTKTDEESLECLCKLLSTLGKDLETKNQDLDIYFKQMQDIIEGKESSQVSSRVLSKLKRLIKLRHKQRLTCDDSIPKTMSQIQKGAETESSDTQKDNMPLRRLKKSRDSDNQRTCGRRSTEEGGWSQPVRSQTQRSFDMPKLKPRSRHY